MEKTDKIAITGAFNKTKNRYNNNLKSILKQLVDYGKNMQKRGFKIIFFGTICLMFMASVQTILKIMVLMCCLCMSIQLNVYMNYISRIN
jgi:hypothetical protein